MVFKRPDTALPGITFSAESARHFCSLLAGAQRRVACEGCSTPERIQQGAILSAKDELSKIDKISCGLSLSYAGDAQTCHWPFTGGLHAKAVGVIPAARLSSAVRKQVQSTAHLICNNKSLRQVT